MNLRKRDLRFVSSGTTLKMLIILFFSCAVAKVVWGALGSCLESSRCPKNLRQSFTWLYAYMPGGKEFYTLLTATICYSIWIT
jgi:hypothetical protein